MAIEYSDRGLRRRRGTDKWEVTFSTYDTKTGETGNSYHTVEGSTETKAKKNRDILRDQLNQDEAPHPDNTVSQFLDIHIRKKKRKVEASTILDYEKDSKRIKKYPLAEMRIALVTIDDIEDWVDNLIEDGYEPRTIQKSFRLLKAAFKTALGREAIKKNPCDHVDIPSIENKPVTALSIKERTQLLTLVLKAPLSMMVLVVVIALSLGLRRAEICALQWDDFLDNKILHVRHSVGLGSEGRYLKKCKNREERRLPILDYVYAMAMTYKAQRMQEAEALGLELGSFVFGEPGTNSSFYDPDKLGKQFKPLMNLAGLDYIMHDLRHTFATMLVASNVDIATVAYYLGDSIEATQKYYVGTEVEAQRGALVKIAECLQMDKLAS